MKRRSLLMIVAAVAFAAASSTSLQSQTSLDNPKQARIELVREFLRELEVLYRLQETAKKEFAEDPSATGKLMTSIRVGTRTVMEMETSIYRLDKITVDGKWAEFRTMLQRMHQNRTEIVQEMNEMSKSLLSGPKPGVNYGSFTARVPELTAQVEQVDKLIFQMSQALFFGLVDEGRAGSDGKLHHLLLTRKDRADMIRLIDKIFGNDLEDKNATTIVSAAWVIKYGLVQSQYKAADEN